MELNESMYSRKEAMDSDGIIFSYSGPVNQAVIEGFGNVLRERLMQDNIGIGETIRVFSVFVEQLQNIIFYAKDGNSNHLHSGMVIIGKSENNYFISGSNEVSHKQMVRIGSKLQEILALSPEELKKEYRKVRKIESDQESKGAGLGFMEMVRKSSKPLKYKFEKISENRYYFTINITI